MGDAARESTLCAVAGLCLTTRFCPKWSKVAQKVLGAILILVFVIWTFYGAVPAVAHPFSAKTHEPLYAAFVAIPDLSHHVDRPILLLKSSQGTGSVLGWYPSAPHVDFVFQGNHTGFANVHFLTRDQQIVERNVIWSFASRQTGFAEIDSIAALNDCRLGAARVHDYETSFDFVSVVPRNESEGFWTFIKSDMPDAQSWAIGNKELQPSDSVLLPLNISLLPGEKHLLFGGLSRGSQVSSLCLSSFGHDPRSFVRADQKKDLKGRNYAQSESEGGDPPSVIRDSFIWRFWDSDYGRCFFGLLIGLFYCALIWRWQR